MNIAYIILALVLALLVTFSGTGKLRKNPGVIEGLKKVGVPERAFPYMGILLLLAAVGLVAGIWIRPLGVAAAAGTTIYFLGAVIAHLRARDVKGISGPMVFLIAAIATAIIGALSL